MSLQAAEISLAYSALLDESNNSDHSCGDISTHNQSNETLPFCTQCGQGGISSAWVPALNFTMVEQ